MDKSIWENIVSAIIFMGVLIGLGISGAIWLIVYLAHHLRFLWQ